MRTDMSGPLSGVRVVEMGSFIAGPYCGQILADLGAELIKIEPPGTGDTIRQWGLRDADGEALWWAVIGRNKRSVTLDVRKPEGRDIARRLILQSDVLVENFRPGVLEKLGLDPTILRRERPELIVARVSGFGQDGPYGKRAGFAAVAEAMAGLRHLTGYPDRAPTRVGLSIGDTLAGLFAAIGVLAALTAQGRGRAGGQVVDVSIVESILAVMESVLTEYSANGAVRGRTGAILPGIAPSNLYPTADGSFVLIAANADNLFQRLATAMDRPELARDARYATHAARGAHQDELDDIVGAWTAGLPRDEILTLMEQQGVPAGPVNDVAAVSADPHFRARGAVVDVPLPSGRMVSMQGAFPRLSETPPQVRWAGARLGAHTAEVLTEQLGFSESEIEQLQATGVV
jgi:crotonobetainyl-CoA:carnitine CoA-transferase CaiB-like acyl-CoA transferase